MSASRAERLGEQIRTEASKILTRQVHDPGVGFVTITRVRVSADLQVARIYYTALGDQAALRTTERALVRVAPFVRRQLAERLGLRRVPEMSFVFDKSIAHQARVEELLQEIHANQSRATPDDSSSDDPDD
ncbi:MAG TPA: 30S ribosome-binding factor RbfA [Vicinamibacterales bacterium]|nr:30S ribosome-binding factor RbfA [Vicinamibacterales bacterium]